MRASILKSITDKLEASTESFKVGVILGLIVYAILVFVLWPYCIIFALNT